MTSDVNDHTFDLFCLCFVPYATPINWSSKRGKTIARCSMEAEYHMVASTTVEINWIQNLLREFHAPLPATPVIYYDNVATKYFATIASSIPERSSSLSTSILFVAKCPNNNFESHGHPAN